MDIHKLRTFLTSEEWIRSLFETSGESILLVEHATGNIIDANRSACVLYGYSKEEFYNLVITSLFAEHGTNGSTIKNNTTEVPLKYHRKKDGTTFPAEVSIGYFEFESHLFHTLFIRDLTNRLQIESALRLSEAQLSNAMKLARLGHWEYDVATDLFTFNDNFYAIFNTTAEQVGGYTMSSCDYANKFIHPDEAMLVGIETKKAIETDNPSFTRYLEHKYISSNGKTGYLAVRIFLVKDEQGRTIKTYGVNQDITERKLAEQTLKESEERYRTLFENSLEAILLTDYKREIYDANPAACKMFGLTVDEIRSKGLDGLLDTTDNHMEHDFAEKGQATECRELKFKHSSGALFTGEVFSTVFKNKDGRTLTSMFIRDITNRKKAEETIKEERTLLRNIVDNLPIALYLKDNQARKVLCNPMDLKFIGRPASDVIGRNDRELLPSEVAERTIADDFEVLTTGRPVINREEHIVNNQGKSVWLNTIKIANRNQFGDIMGIIGMGIDITERKKAEEELIKAKEKAEESEKLKTAFLCNMSHEIRTPMNAILGFSEYLVRPGISEEKRASFSKVIKDRVHDLLAIVEDILDISQIEVGQMNLVNATVYVEHLLKQSYDTFQLRKDIIRPNSNIKFSLLLENEIKGLKIITDEIRLKQVIANLLENAFKFTEDGLIELSCKIVSDHELLFTVSDTGIGIAADKQSIVFDRFRQVDDFPETRRFGGTGLGLAIAKGLVTLMGGEIWLESRENVGSKFFFTLPFQSTEVHEKELIENDMLNIPHWKGKTILIVEDDKTNAELLKEMILPTKAKTIIAYKASDAITEFKKNHDIDIILLDIRLPDINGIEIVPIIKELRPYVPVIAQTAYASASDYQKCMDVGCDGYISKPINYEEIIEIIDRFIH